MALTIEQVAHALKQTDGNVSETARALGVSRTTVYKKINAHEGLQEILDDARHSLIDLAESQLRALIKEKNVTAIIFTLKTQGKDRGYIERSEWTGANGGAIETVVRVVYEDRLSADTDD